MPIKINFKQIVYIVFITSFIFFAGCGGNDDDSSSSNSERGKLVSSEESGSYDTGTISAFLISFGLPADVAYTVTMYDIIYKTTDAQGNTINASGVVSVPANKTGASPLLSYQHGTIFEDAEAPTNSQIGDPSALLASSFGMVVARADYVGYGESKGTVHPYLLAQPSANASIDLIRATKSFLSEKNIAINDQLFLAGYSEGGYATMAMHKEIETNLSSELTVTGSVPGAGPYDLTTTSAAIMASEQLAFPAFVGFIFKAYQTAYSMDGLIDRTFQSPYNTVVDTSYDATKSGETINSELTSTTADLITESFRSEYLSTTGEADLKAKLAANNVHDWSPKAPVRMFHGQEDATVPYINSSNAFAAMSQKGADVTLQNCAAQPSNHSNCGAAYAAYLFTYLLANASDL